MNLLYFLLLVIITIYSYSLVDLNITLINNHNWEIFREKIIYLGYFRRDISAIVYLVVIALLFVFYFYFVKNFRKINIIRLAFIIAGVLLLAYPFLSRDLFNYIFDAKILTFYHKNPYLYKALDFPKDPWIRFMHWTHRSYPYGPVFLPITLIPSLLGFNKFILNFFFFKLTFFSFYITSVYLLNRLNKRSAVIFAFNPLVLIEGLVNCHNDLISAAIAIIGIYFLLKNKNMLSKLILLLSAGIKYITFPLILLTKKKSKGNALIFLLIIASLLYLAINYDWQPWYYLVIFAFLPFYETLISQLGLFFAGLLLTYYPYIKYDNHLYKKEITLFFLAFNLIYLLWRNSKINCSSKMK